MKKVSIEHIDDCGSFRYQVPVSAIKDLMTPELLEELKKFLLKGPIREDNIENKDYLETLIKARLVCGFYFRTHSCCYGLTELGHGILKTE